MKTKLLGLIAGMALLFGATFAGSASPYEVTIEQVGGNVVATGSGEIDTTGFPSPSATGSGAGAFVGPDVPYIYIGTGGWADYAVSITGPSNFGSGTFSPAANGSTGGAVGLEDIFPTYEIWLPYNYTSGTQYVSGTPLSDSSTWYGQTLVSLGLTPGIYVWNYGSAADQTFTIDVVAPTATPLPAALPLFAGGLGVIGRIAGRRKRKAAATAAA